MAQKEKEINDDLYSRQIGTFGMETMRKLVQLKVLIIGMRGLGVEIAKNIILSGPKSVTIYDEFYPTINDLSSNFYISEDDVGKRSRDQACLDKLKGLNPYVTVELLRFPPTNDFMSLFQKTLLNYNVVVYTELFNTNFLINVNKFCRDNNIKFIYALNFGLVGYIFSDFGNNHIIFDESGSTTISFNIKNITKSADQTLITIDNENGQNNFNIGDGGFITFKDIEGMTELNGKEYKIKYENYESFFIPVDSTKFHDYIKGGKAIRVPKNIQKKYFDYNQRSNIITDSLHEFLIMDEKKVGRNELLYMVLICIHDYFISHNCVLPELNNMTQAKEIEKNVKNFYDLCKKNKYDCYKKIQEYDEKLVLNVIRWCRAQISPVAAFFGGIVAHEIIKSTGKYEPIDQWLIMDFFEMVENISENADRSLKGSRYDDQIAIFGNEIQKKIEQSKIFMIGAGATGCEFLKNFAMMGFCTNDKDSKFIVTDNDSIEVSNLSRQFLFRQKDVGSSKAVTASNSVKLMNPKFNVVGLQKKVCEETEDYFDEDFWNKLDYVIMAVDSLQARKYIDTRVVKFEKCSVDAGTMGTVANTQIIVPHKTMSYGDNKENEEEAPKVIPMCTLRHFPSIITHCIEWSRDVFNAYFISTVNDIKNYFTNFETFKQNIEKEGSATQNLEKLLEEKIIIEFLINNDYNKLIEYAVKKYTDNFDYRIQQLLYNFPPDCKNEEGKPFWSGSKKLPHNIPYNSNDELSFLFVKSYVHIISHAFGMNLTKEQKSDEYIKNISAKVNLPKFSPKNMTINISENANDANSGKEMIVGNDLKQDEKMCEKIFEELKKLDKSKVDANKINAEEFEKDHDENGHIDFIHSSANLRARNYEIVECDRPTTKITAGKIIPTIMTTTATVAGQVAMQLYTLIHTHENKYLRNLFFNLATNYYLFQEPYPPILNEDKTDEEEGGPLKCIPNKWTIWDRLEMKGPKTCQEFFDEMFQKYGIKIDMLIANGEIIMSSLDEESFEKNKNKKIEDLYLSMAKVKPKKNINYILLQLSANIDKATIKNKEFKDVSVEMPPIKYIFK
jgi:ubiquitin-activating enzyme E1